MTIVEFLLARIGEDEGRIDDACWYTDAEGSRIKPRLDELVEVTKARVFRRELAECEAKRRIVRWAKTSERDSPFTETDLTIASAIVADGLDPETPVERFVLDGLHPQRRPAVQALAAVYADHPDYDEAWSTA